MSLRLVALPAGADPELLVAALRPGFGGNEVATRELLAQTLALLASDPRPDPWGAYIAWEDETAVGTCAFKWAPDAAGTVEIAYTTLPAFERRGHATAMAGELTRIAHQAGAPLVVAHTLPEENASTRALRHNGFAFAGAVEDPEDGTVWRWEHRCPA